MVLSKKKRTVLVAISLCFSLFNAVLPSLLLPSAPKSIPFLIALCFRILNKNAIFPIPYFLEMSNIMSA